MDRRGLSCAALGQSWSIDIWRVRYSVGNVGVGGLRPSSEPAPDAVILSRPISSASPRLASIAFSAIFFSSMAPPSSNGPGSGRPRRAPRFSPPRSTGAGAVRRRRRASLCRRAARGRLRRGICATRAAHCLVVDTFLQVVRARAPPARCLARGIIPVGANTSFLQD